MDTRQFDDGDYVDVEYVLANKDLQGVIMGSEAKTSKKGFPYLQLTIQIGAKTKWYAPNKDSRKNMQLEWGYESDNWMGKVLNFKVRAVEGKQVIMAEPSSQVPRHYVGLKQAQLSEAKEEKV